MSEILVQHALDWYAHCAAGGTPIAGAYTDPPRRGRWYRERRAALARAALEAAGGDPIAAVRLPLGAVPGAWPPHPTATA